MTEENIELSVLLVELRKSDRKSDKAMAHEIRRIVDALIEAAQRDARESVFDFIEHWEPLIDSDEQSLVAQVIAEDARRYWTQPATANVVSADAAQLVADAQRTALEQAAQVVSRRVVDLGGKIQAEILALLPQPAPATPPLCSVCRQPMQRGNTWLCIADGTTLDAGQDSDVIGVRE